MFFPAFAFDGVLNLSCRVVAFWNGFVEERFALLPFLVSFPWGVGWHGGDSRGKDVEVASFLGSSVPCELRNASIFIVFFIVFLKFLLGCCVVGCGGREMG